MNTAIAKDFSFLGLIKFALPSMIMMIFQSLYTIVDGLFVARYVSTDALSAVNIVYPVINVTVGFAIMFATGSSAIIAKLMGEGKPDKARRIFTTIILTGLLFGIVIGIIGITAQKPLFALFSVPDELFQLCRVYLGTLMLFSPFLMLQLLYQTLFVTAGKPAIGLILTIAAGVTNIVLDYVFIAQLGMGVLGAALATAAGYVIPAVYGTVFFIKNKTQLHFSKPALDFKSIGKAMSNGSSEMVTNLSMSVTTFLFNTIMLKMLGVDGVAAITIVLYAQFVMVSLHLGFSIGVAPIISYNYGCQNMIRLKKTFKSCISFIGAVSVLIFIAAQILSPAIVTAFAPVGSAVNEIATYGMVLFSFSFLFEGTNVFASALFTALSNGRVSALISFLRTFVFIIAGMLILPQLIGVEGVWLAVPVAELLTVIIAVFCMVKGKSVYQY